VETVTRVFIAFTIPKNLTQEIEKITDLVKTKIPADARAKFETSDKAHMSLAILGNLDDFGVQAVLDATSEAASTHLPFHISFSGINYFYKSKKGSESVVFLDIDDPEKQIKAFYKDLFKSLTAASFSPPYRVTPHVTLARVKQMKRAADQQRMLSDISEMELDNYPKFTLSSVEVYESLQHYGETTNFKLIKSIPLGKPIVTSNNAS
jgi:2'-5' RNA ligase